ncbi:MAG TPA: hypothetical protein PLD27_01965 [bacterium]|nr:hypothetical protein [bacterium]HOL46690.1 hypothetical protein [bacterium]HPQ18378.1 hypothetical protein [bacterium]
MKIFLLYIFIFFFSFLFFFYLTFPYEILINYFNKYSSSKINIQIEKISPKLFLNFYLTNTKIKYGNIVQCSMKEIKLIPSLINFFLIKNEVNDININLFSSNKIIINKINTESKIKKNEINGKCKIENMKINFLNNLINLQEQEIKFDYSKLDNIFEFKIKSEEINGEIKLRNSQIIINLRFDERFLNKYLIIRQIIPANKFNNNTYTDVLTFQ